MTQDLTDVDGLDVSGLTLCTWCRRLRGPWVSSRADELVQLCRCDDGRLALAGVVAEAWPRYDYNTAAELCRCCTAEVLRSGSRWSVWFCEPCKRRAGTVNHKAAAAVVPIGRHSMMHGYGIAGPAPSQEDIGAFHVATLGLFDGIKRLSDWADHTTAGHLESTGLDAEPSVPLGRYLTTVASLDRAVEFRRMLEWMAHAGASGHDGNEHGQEGTR